MLTAEDVTARIATREAAMLRAKMHPDTAKSVTAAMQARIARQEAGLIASAVAYAKTQERLREVRGF